MGIERNGAEPTGIVRTTRNLFDEKLELGSINGITGELSTSNARLRSNSFIRLKPGTYSFSCSSEYSFYIFIYDTNGQYLTSFPSNWTNNVDRFFEFERDIKIVFKKKDGSDFIVNEGDDINFQLEEGAEATPYVPHTVSATKVVRTTRNLFDGKIYKNNVYFDKNANEISNGQYFISNKIFVKENSEYIMSITSSMFATHNVPSVAWYDENENVISTTQYILFNQNNSKICLSPVGATFCRISVYKNQAGGWMFEEGSTPTPHVPHTITIWQPPEEN